MSVRRRGAPERARSLESETLEPEVHPDDAERGTGRRKFLGYLVAAPTLAVATQIGTGVAGGQRAEAAIPSVPQPEDIFDLGDLQNLAAAPTSGLISVQVNKDGTAHFALPRCEVGQGLTTSMAMIIAEEMDLPMEKVTVTLADARPELLLNQLTGGSNTTRSMYMPIRTASAIARERLKATAAAQWNVSVNEVRTADGMVSHRSGKMASYGELTAKAAVTRTQPAKATLKPRSSFKVLGTPRNRVDALAAVTGRKQFTLDLDVPNAKPTMVARPPTLNGTPAVLMNEAEIKAMPGITDVAVISTGIAIRGETFGQCIDAVRVVKAQWNKGPLEGQSDATVEKALRGAEIPLVVPGLLTKHIDAEFTFHAASNSPLETGSAIADVRKDRAEIWSCLKVPIKAKQQIAAKLGLPENSVSVHVTEGGGSFGRHLFHDAATEAAEASQKMGKPVKLMWSRTDDFRQGRIHPMSRSRVRATYALGNVVSFEQRHTSVRTDFTHGLGEMITATAASLPVAGNLSFAQTIFLLSQSSPYNFGVTTQLLNEVDLPFTTGSMRNIYSPNVLCASELVVDQLATAFKKDAVQFRREFLKDERLLACLNKAAEVGGWGKKLPKGVAQGISVHAEYRGAVACLMEVDARPETINREVPADEGVTGPRVTKALLVIDPGMAINPRGLEAQMIGGMNDGIAMCMTSSLHLEDGYFLEGSWNNYFYTRQWNTPPEMQVVIMPDTSDQPCGAGELAVAPAFAATACAYARATGKMPTEFPINHRTLSFEPLPQTPSTPQSPEDGLNHAY